MTSIGTSLTATITITATTTTLLLFLLLLFYGFLGSSLASVFQSGSSWAPGGFNLAFLFIVGIQLDFRWLLAGIRLGYSLDSVGLQSGFQFGFIWS